MKRLLAVFLAVSPVQANMRAPVRVNVSVGTAASASAAGAALSLPPGNASVHIPAPLPGLSIPGSVPAISGIQAGTGQAASIISPTAQEKTLGVPRGDSKPLPQESPGKLSAPALEGQALEIAVAGVERSEAETGDDAAGQLNGREARDLSRRVVDLQGRLGLAGWLHSASTLESEAKGTAGRQDSALLGRTLMDAVIPKLLANRAGRNIGEAARQVPVQTHLFSPDIREDWLRPFQAAIYDGVFNTMSFNRNVVGLSDAEWGRFADDPALQERVAELLAPTVLHELKHWRTRILTGDIALRENEYEAYHVQALFILERLLEDPEYLKRLPAGLSSRYIDLLQAWLEGPQALAGFVAQRYLKTPELFSADPAAMIAENEEQIAGWRDRLENYDQRKRELIAEIEKSKRIEAAMSGERVSLGGSRSGALAAELRDFPSRGLTRHILMELEDALHFWKDPTRLLITKKYYEVVLRRMYEEWKGWKAEHPDFVLPIPPTTWQRFTAWLGRVFGRA